MQFLDLTKDPYLEYIKHFFKSTENKSKEPRRKNIDKRLNQVLLKSGYLNDQNIYERCLISFLIRAMQNNAQPYYRTFTQVPEINRQFPSFTKISWKLGLE